MIDLSVLVCSVSSRYNTFGPKIQKQVFEQYEALEPHHRERIEVIVLTDTKSMMLGSKRNVMVDIAQGQYVQFIDDDDRIESDMFATLLDAIEANPGVDVITFGVNVKVNDGPVVPCYYSKDFGTDRNLPDRFERIPNHICCVRRELAQLVPFPNILKGEDAGYSKALLPHLDTEHRIDRVLYHYDYSDETTETQQKLKPRMLVGRRQPPIVDVVILSNAKDERIRQMTQEAIDTCIAGAAPYCVKVWVVEQHPYAQYRDAEIVRNPGDFNYNRAANKGISQGKAEWVMVANNDLIFHENWLRPLLSVSHPIMSPKCPRDIRQRHITRNAIGDQTAVHLSGWCFMMTRELWSRIGHLDECVEFWFSDDVTIEQVKALGLLPMLVPSSQVTHIQSVTLNQEGARMDELTWKQLAQYEARYGPHRLSTDPRYQEYKARCRA